MADDKPATEDAQTESPWMDAIRANCNMRNAKAVVLLLGFIAYFIAAVAVHMPGEDWGIGDCLYFAVVVVTTVGYGDYLPSTDNMKLVTIVFVHFGLSIVVLALGIIQDIVTHISITAAVKKEMGRKGGQNKTNAVGIFDMAAWERKQKRIGVAKAVALYVFFLVAGTLFFAKEMDDYQEDYGMPAGSFSHRLVDGLYLSVITITTVGFGDFSPKSDQGKIFSMFFMLIGIPVFGSAFSMINDLLYSGGSEPLVLHKIQGALDQNKYQHITAFVDDFRKQAGNYAEMKEGHVSRLEFLAFVLTQNGVAEVSNIANVMRNFDEIDITHTGFISKHDVGVCPSQDYTPKEKMINGVEVRTDVPKVEAVEEPIQAIQEHTV